MAKKKIVTYKMTKPAKGGVRRPTVKYGHTNDPKRRERENAGKGDGDKLEVIREHKTKEDAEKHERKLIREYERRNGRLPPGNKQG